MKFSLITIYVETAARVRTITLQNARTDYDALVAVINALVTTAIVMQYLWIWDITNVKFLRHSCIQNTRICREHQFVKTPITIYTITLSTNTKSLCRDEGSQVAVLRIIQRLLKKLTVPELQYIFPSVTAFLSHPNSLCRELMYDILIWIYDTFRCALLYYTDLYFRYRDIVFQYM